MKPHFTIWAEPFGAAIGDWPKHRPAAVSTHCPWRALRRWSFTLTVFEGSGHWLLEVGPLQVTSL